MGSGNFKVTRRGLLSGGLFLTAALGATTLARTSVGASGGACKVTPRRSFTDVGSGPALVCSHGFMMDRSMFDEQVSALKDRYRVVAFDSRARSQHCKGPYDLDDLVEDCRSLMDHLRIERAVLVGMSMGGWMSLRFALKYPDRVDALVLIDSSSDADTEEKRALLAEKFEPLLKQKKLPKDYVEWVLPLMFGEWTRANNPAVVSLWREKFLQFDARAVYDEANSWRDRKDITREIASIKVPTLIIHGEEDEAEPVRDATPMVSAIPGAQLVTVPRAGHTSNVEQPELVNRAIAEFLAKEVYKGNHQGDYKGS